MNARLSRAETESASTQIGTIYVSAIRVMSSLTARALILTSATICTMCAKTDTVTTHPKVHLLAHVHTVMNAHWTEQIVLIRVKATVILTPIYVTPRTPLQCLLQNHTAVANAMSNQAGYSMVSAIPVQWRAVKNLLNCAPRDAATLKLQTAILGISMSAP